MFDTTLHRSLAHWPVGRLTGAVLALALGLIVAACTVEGTPRAELQPVPGMPEGAADNGDEPGWRALLIAGDVSSPAFNNAVSSFRDRLVALGMSPARISTVRSGPTLQSATLRQQDLAGHFSFLRAPAADGCLLFMTSHGIPDGLLIRTVSGVAVLDPATLGMWLDSTCDGKPTVVILSGCYSGVFLDYLSGVDSRAVFTAARRDRTSFGCSASDVLNIFDACLLSSMVGNATWTELSSRTRQCVETREGELNAGASLPQTYVGASLVGMRLREIP